MSVCSSERGLLHVHRLFPWPDAEQKREVSRIERAAFPGEEAYKHDATDHSSGQHWFVVERSSMQPVSLVAYVRLLDREDGSVYLEDLAVDPEYRRGGVGACLVSHALGSFAERRVFTRVKQDDARAEAFYTKLGFRPTGTWRTGPYGRVQEWKLA